MPCSAMTCSQTLPFWAKYYRKGYPRPLWALQFHIATFHAFWLQTHIHVMFVRYTRRTTRSTVSGSRWSTETTSSCASWRRTTRAAENAASPPYCTWWRCRSSPAAPSAVSTRSTRYRLLNSVTSTLVILHSHVDYNLSLKLGKTLQKSLFTAYLLCGHLLLAARTFGMAFLINTRLH